MGGRFSSRRYTSGKPGGENRVKNVTQTSRKDHKGAGIEHYLCFQTVKFLLLSLLFVVFYLSMSTVICIFAAFSEYGLYRDYSTGYNP